MDGPTLSLHARPSRRLFAWQIALHTAAVLAPWAAGIPLVLRIGVSLAVLLGLIRLLHAHRAEAAGWRLGVRDGAWTLAEHGREGPAELLPDSVVWERLVVLRLRCAGRVRSLVLLEDSCGADELRRLRVVLRMRPGLSSAPRV